jgi:hypothetical protein
MNLDDKKKKKKPAPAPAKTKSPAAAASSSLSSLASTPPAAVETESRDESPFQDPSPPPSARADYGDFMSYYIQDGDDDAQADVNGDKPKKAEKADNLPDKKTTEKTTENANGKRKRQSTSKASTKDDTDPSLEPARKRGRPSKRASLPTKATETAAPSPQVEEHSPQAPTPVQAPPQPASNQQPLPRPLPPRPAVPQQLPRTPYAPTPGWQRPPPPNQTVPQIAAPIIQFLDIPLGDKPQTPDTITVMIQRLQTLSEALTNFGGVPGVPTTPPVEKTNPEPKVAREPTPKSPSNPLDGFLAMFGDDEGDDDSEEEEQEDQMEDVQVVQEAVRDLDRVLENPGDPDGPLSYGIQFIQNALRSWAQQRTTHQITQQLQAQQQQWLIDQQRRGPGRPKKYELPLPGHPGGPPPVIEMPLATTPEGVAIQSFHSVLNSGCLQVNVKLPVELARALRHLYMQIDHLINQGAKEDHSMWFCMSYSAQIAAHNARVNRWKEAQSRVQEEIQRQQAMHNQQMMANMGFTPRTTYASEAEAQHAHAIDLERRRSAQHAQQQPYISQQHLNPMHLSRQSSADQIASQAANPPAQKSLSGGEVDGENSGGDSMPTDPKTAMSSLPSAANDASHVMDEDVSGGISTLNCRNETMPPTGASATATPRGARSRSGSNTKDTPIDLTSDGPRQEQAQKQSARPASSAGFVAINKSSAAAKPRSRSNSESETIAIT